MAVNRRLESGQIYVTVDILALTVEEGKLRILLSRRREPPFQGCWALFGKLVGQEETAEEAARCLLREMLPPGEGYLEQLYTFADLGRDPRGRVISIAYLAVLPWGSLGQLREGQQLFQLGMDREGLCLRGPGGELLRRRDLAFDHGSIVETGLLRLRGKLQYTDIGFHFLCDTGSFTLRELQTVYEAVQGRPTDGGNFRRSMQSRYIDTGRIVRTDQREGARQKRGRPAARYRLSGPEGG